MFILFMRNHNERKYLMEIDRTKKMDIETYGSLLKTILTIVTPFILSTFIYNFSTSMNQTVYAKVMMKYHAFTQVEAATNYGIFAGKAVVIANIPIAFSSAMASALIPGISASFAKGEKKSTKEKVSLATKVTMLIAIPSAFGFLFLAKPIMQLLFPQKASLDTASALLRALAVTVVFYSLSTLTNAILQSIGKVTAPVVHASIALVVQAIVLVIGLFTLKHSLYALVLAQIAYSFVMCLLNGYAVRKHLRFRQRPQRVYILPTIASLIMGALAFATYRLLNLAVASNVICLAAAIFVAVLVYFTLVIKLHIVGERQLLAIPKGTSIVRFAKKLKLL
jgi:stage V sporulation protein B